MTGLAVSARPSSRLYGEWHRPEVGWSSVRCWGTREHRRDVRVCVDGGDPADVGELSQSAQLDEHLRVTASRACQAAQHVLQRPWVVTSHCPHLLLQPRS